MTELTTQKLAFHLVKAPASKDGALIGYRYQVVIPEALRGEKGRDRETIYESYVYPNPLDEKYHDERATAQYNQYVAELRKRAELKGYKVGGTTS